MKSRLSFSQSRQHTADINQRSQRCDLIIHPTSWLVILTASSAKPYIAASWYQKQFSKCPQLSPERSRAELKLNWTAGTDDWANCKRLRRLASNSAVQIVDAVVAAKSARGRHRRRRIIRAYFTTRSKPIDGEHSLQPLSVAFLPPQLHFSRAKQTHLVIIVLAGLKFCLLLSLIRRI